MVNNIVYSYELYFQVNTTIDYSISIPNPFRDFLKKCIIHKGALINQLIEQIFIDKLALTRICVGRRN